MFFDTALFPWLKPIEARWQDIRDEAARLSNESFMQYPERHLYDHSWKVFGLHGWGVRFDRQCDLAPKTAELVATIPGLYNAGFSRLGPKTHIRAHLGGPPQGLLRLHVPLIVPEECVFRVMKETRPWKEGECFVFDDCYEHEAWNNSSQNRIVLIADFPAHNLTVPFKPRRTETFVRRMFGKRTDYIYPPLAAAS